jgi:hypothetical protein
VKSREGRSRTVWTSWEVCLPGDGSWTRPVSDLLASGVGDPPETALNKVRLLQTLGLPDARKSLIIDKADDEKPPILILKCKPSCWRLYFYARHDERRIIYLYGKCKKKNKRDSQDSRNARAVFERLRDGGVQVARFPLPSDEGF